MSVDLVIVPAAGFAPGACVLCAPDDRACGKSQPGERCEKRVGCSCVPLERGGCAVDHGPLYYPVTGGRPRTIAARRDTSYRLSHCECHHE